VIGQLGELAELACDGRQVYLRYSRGPEADTHQASRDYESGLELPGLSVIPLAPPSWWSRPVPDWLAPKEHPQQISEGEQGIEKKLGMNTNADETSQHDQNTAPQGPRRSSR
jgi:hypothetical protein